MFSKASQTEWQETFDFPTGISCFPMYIVSTPGYVYKTYASLKRISRYKDGTFAWTGNTKKLTDLKFCINYKMS